MATANILYKRSLPVNQYISVYIPTVGEILDNEDDYNDLVSRFVAMPIDFAVSLDDNGIDFSKIDEYTLFLMLFQSLKDRDTHLIFSDLDLSKFDYAMNDQNGEILLIDTEHDIRIDRAIHDLTANAIRKIHHLKKDIRKPGNDAARKFMIDRARRKMKRNQNSSEDSQLESLIVAMVNTEQYKYDFEGTRELSIYQFHECVRQIMKKVDYDNKMRGIYAGTVNAKDLNPDDLNWLIHK